MTVLLPRDKNASRNVDAPKPAKADKDGNVTLNKSRDINVPVVAKSEDVPLNKNTKKVFIKTYGCQMNVYDSERMADVLAPIGYAPVDAPDEADLVILNTTTNIYLVEIFVAGGGRGLVRVVEEDGDAGFGDVGVAAFVD